MFETIRPLPLLQTLEVEEHPTRLYGRTRCNHEGLQLLVQCCSGLRRLGVGAAVDQHEDLSPLMQLQQLTALSVYLELDDLTAQGLAVLTGLRRLTIHTGILLAESLVWLTKLRNLEELRIGADDSPEAPGFCQISEELLKHPGVDQFGLHLETRLVSRQVQCQFVHLL
jgi:hypothetical protein